MATIPAFKFDIDTSDALAKVKELTEAVDSLREKTEELLKEINSLSQPKYVSFTPQINVGKFITEIADSISEIADARMVDK